MQGKYLISKIVYSPDIWNFVAPITSYKTISKHEVLMFRVALIQCKSVTEGLLAYSGIVLNRCFFSQVSPSQKMLQIDEAIGSDRLIQ